MGKGYRREQQRVFDRGGWLVFREKASFCRTRADIQLFGSRQQLRDSPTSSDYHSKPTSSFSFKVKLTPITKKRVSSHVLSLQANLPAQLSEVFGNWLELFLVQGMMVEGKANPDIRKSSFCLILLVVLLGRKVAELCSGSSSTIKSSTNPIIFVMTKPGGAEFPFKRAGTMRGDLKYSREIQERYH